MKSIKAILGFALATTGIGGAVAVGATSLSNVQNETTIKTDAASTGNIYVRCTRPTGWGDTLYCHYWGGSSESTWPGVNNVTTYQNSYNQTVFVFEIPGNSKGLLFDNGSWQTNNLSLNNTGNAWYLGDNIYNDRSDFGTWTPSTYLVNVYDSYNFLNKDVNLYAFRGEANTGIVSMNSLELEYLSDNFYTISVDEMFATVIVAKTNWAAETVHLTPDSSKYYVITGVNNTSISGSWYDSTDYVYAMDWVNHEMHMSDIPTSTTGDTNACRDSGNGYFTKALNAYNTYTGIKSQLKYVTGYEDAIERFKAWATANGRTATFDSSYNLTINSRQLTMLPVTDDKKLAILIGAIVIIACGSVAFIAIRKKKHQ